MVRIVFLTKGKTISTAKYRIVIADDDDLLVRLLQHKFAQKDVEVLPAYDGETALSLTQKEKPDLVILDGMMPGMDGFEVLLRLKQDKDTQTIPVLLLSARKLESDIVMALERGAEDYIVKPFMPEELWARIRKILSS